jgi:hypothetical protein
LHFGQQIVQIFDKIGNQERLLRKIATESNLGDEELEKPIKNKGLAPNFASHHC